MNSLRDCSLVLLLFCGLTLVARADEPDSAAPALEKLVVEAAGRFEKAFAARDPQAIGKLFTEEAEYVDASGLVLHGRDAITAEYTAHFEVSPPGAISVEIVAIRPVAKGVLTEEGVSTFEAPDAGPTTQTRYTATHVRQEDGTWLIASLRELEDAVMTPHERLKRLGWLIGAWQEEDEATIVRTTWKWSDNENFLLSEFSAREGETVLLEGTHRIGWDAERKQFRSWIFDSNGGAVDGWWTEGDDGVWRVRLSGVDAEGERVQTTATYFRDGADAIVISQEDRSEGSLQLPGSSHRVVRQPPGPQTAAAAAAEPKTQQGSN